tara:strand:+ start:250 stop:552 length:303 start_codon:yes stop_codon:yes gene_type:complete
MYTTTTTTKIHLKNLRGIYTIVTVTDKIVTVTCNTWNAKANHPIKPITRDFPISEIKCLMGVPGIKQHRKNLQAAEALLYLMKLIQKDKCNKFNTLLNQI